MRCTGHYAAHRGTDGLGCSFVCEAGRKMLEQMRRNIMKPVFSGVKGGKINLNMGKTANIISSKYTIEL